jgi:large subunit ribosomal protein L11
MFCFYLVPKWFLTPFSQFWFLGIEKGSKEPQREKVGKVTADQVRTIAQEKLPDLNCKSIESAMRIIAGTAANMGIDVDPPILVKKEKVLL